MDLSVDFGGNSVKHCDNRNRDFDCGAKLRNMPSDENEAAEIVSALTSAGIL